MGMVCIPQSVLWCVSVVVGVGNTPKQSEFVSPVFAHPQVLTQPDNASLGSKNLFSDLVPKKKNVPLFSGYIWLR
jgi:hypothetical protein